MNPRQLMCAIQDIVVEEGRCQAFWDQHREPLTTEELVLIELRVHSLFTKLFAEPLHAGRS